MARTQFQNPHARQKSGSPNPTETAFPRLAANPTASELREYFTPTAAERALANQVNSRSRDPIDRLFFLLHLKIFGLLGYFLNVSKIPDPIRKHLCRSIGMRELRADDLRVYADSRREAAHVKALRRHFNVRPFDEKSHEWLRTIAHSTATTKHYVADIINVMLEELVRQRFELPGLPLLERLAAEARERVHNEYYRAINENLTPETRSLIDDLLRTPESNPFSGWHVLKREPRRPTNQEVRSYLAHIERLKKLVVQLPAVELPPRKLEFFRDQARASDASEMSRFVAAKRYALAVIFIRHQYARVLDDAADLFTRMISKVKVNAERARLEYQVVHRERTDALIKQLDAMLEAYDQKAPDRARINAIADSLQEEVEVLRARCNEYLAHSGPNFQPFALEPFAPARPLLLNCLEIMGLKSSSNDHNSERMIATLLKYRNHRGRGAIDPASIGLDIKQDLDWLTPSWHDYVLIREKGRPKQIHRAYFELAVLIMVDEELRAGDLYIPDGDRYDDYREQLVTDAVLDEELKTLADKAGFPTDAQAFVESLKNRLIDDAAAMDRDLPQNPDASVVDGRIKLTRPDRAEISRPVQELDQIIRDRMPQMTITDVLLDTSRLLNLPKYFRHVGGDATRLPDIEYRIVTTLLCYGCFLGPSQTQRAIRGLSRKKIAWLNIKYVNEKSLQRAIESAINKYNEYELPGYWGSGKSVAADGTKWSLYDENLISTYHIRHGGYGGLAYCHISDKYIALISHFNPCGVHEGTYILDILENQSDIQPTELHGDTHAQSFTVFGLGYLLGFELMPRIKGVKDLKLYRAAPGLRYKNIGTLFENKPIDWKLIATHFRDMLRVVVSIKQGMMTPSTILRRLGTQSRKNKLYFALRELGRAMRTLFLIKYISSMKLREQIHAATNKNEAYHHFAKRIAFGNGGVIADNLRHEQLKVIRYNHLVANLLILHNVEHMSRVLEALRLEGHAIEPEHLAGLGPYRYEHINFFGDYEVDMDRPVADFAPNRSILPKKSAE